MKLKKSNENDIEILKIRNILFILIYCCSSTPLLAQSELDTIRFWNLAKYSQTTIDNVAADTKHWTLNSKGGRYQNVVETDGNLLTANGTVIPETDGIYFGKGIPAGSLLLNYDRGTSSNGVQTQASKATTLKGLKANQIVKISIRSSSSNASGISEVTNLSGETGPSTYTTTSFKTYTFTVAKDGNVSFTNKAGVIINEIGIYEEQQGEQVETPEITINGNIATITCKTKDAQIFYSVVNHGTIWDYKMPYNGPITLDRSVRLRAAATKTGMKSSEVTEENVNIPLIMPFEGRPFELDPEPLDRGAIATKTSSGMLVNWRLLINDAKDVNFNVYRNGVKLNSSPITTKTNYLDKNGTITSTYTVETLSGGNSIETSTAKILSKGYLDIPLDLPANGTTESGAYMYVPGNCMVADVDGDKEYEIVMKWDPCNTNWDSKNPSAVNDEANTAGQKDNSLSGYTGNVLIDAYKMDGTKLWRIDLGKNIRAGAHYTQLMVYDLDGDGKAEVACKTAPGTIDGKGKNVLMGSDSADADYRTKSGSKTGNVINGPEYLTVFSGLTGEELATTKYIPSRDTVDFGDTYGNRSERYLACVAYLDGIHPSLVMCRGYYTSAFLWAVDFDGKKLNTHWLHSSTKGGYGAYGEGAHGISVADVDGDCKDEIIYGACTIDHDGTLIYRTGLGHGDALHVGDLDPDRTGLEVFMVHEDTTSPYGIEIHDALNGEHLSGLYAGEDVGRGLCADVDLTARGCEYWGFGNNVYNCTGTSISTKRPSVNFRTYWDGEMDEEMTERGVITKWAGRTSSQTTLVNLCSQHNAGLNLIKYTPCLQADIFGDWREEQVYYDATTRAHLFIFSTTYESKYRVPCLMHDHQYRMATIWQTSAYNQPPHLSYYLPDYINYLTGIEEVEKYNTNDSCIYNILGQKIVTPQKGIYIINGKKYLIP